MKKTTKRKLALGIAVAVFAMAALIVHRWWTFRPIIADIMADEIIIAASSFEADHGEIPAQLETLVPKYIRTVKLPWGMAWTYYKRPEGGLTLILKDRGRECRWWYVPPTANTSTSNQDSRQLRNLSWAQLSQRRNRDIERIKMNKRPNILFLMSDQHRADVTGYEGNPS